MWHLVQKQEHTCIKKNENDNGFEALKFGISTLDVTFDFEEEK